MDALKTGLDVLVRCPDCRNTKTVRDYRADIYDRLVCSLCGSRHPEIILPIRLELEGQIAPEVLEATRKSRVERVPVDTADLIMKCLKCDAPAESFRFFHLRRFDELYCPACGSAGRQFRLASMKIENRNVQVRRFLKSSLGEFLQNCRQPRVESTEQFYALNGRSFWRQSHEASFMEIRQSNSPEASEELLDQFSSPALLGDENIVQPVIRQRLIAWKEGNDYFANLNARIEMSLYVTLSSRQHRCVKCQSRAYSIKGDWLELNRVLNLLTSFRLAESYLSWNDELLCPMCWQDHPERADEVGASLLGSIYQSDYWADEYGYEARFQLNRFNDSYVNEGLRDVDEGYTTLDLYSDMDSYDRSDEEGWFYED